MVGCFAKSARACTRKPFRSARLPSTSWLHSKPKIVFQLSYLCPHPSCEKFVRRHWVSFSITSTVKSNQLRFSRPFLRLLNLFERTNNNSGEDNHAQEAKIRFFFWRR